MTSYRRVTSRVKGPPGSGDAVTRWVACLLLVLAVVSNHSGAQDLDSASDSADTENPADPDTGLPTNGPTTHGSYSSQSVICYVKTRRRVLDFIAVH